MTEAAATGRVNQKTRTRRHLLDAAAKLMAKGRTPTLDEVAEEALVSRATAYRYFATGESLLAEAALDIVAPKPEELLDEDAPGDPAARMELVDEALDAMLRGNEAAFRAFLVHSLRQRAENPDVPVRQNRRTALIDAALAPARREFKPSALPLLRRALALVVGTEAMLVFKDVLGVDDDEARRVKVWAIRALVDAARRS